MLKNKKMNVPESVRWAYIISHKIKCYIDNKG